MKLAFAGDVMIGRLVNRYLKTAPFEYPWGDTLPLLLSADARFINLECVISDKGSPWSETPKAFHFRSDAKNVGVLKAASISAVSSANNHAIDFGFEAMLDMLNILDGAGIGHAGAGRNIDEASRPAIAKVRGLNIGFIAFTDNEPVWEAGPKRPGTFYVPVDAMDRRAVALLSLVKDTSKKVDILIVSAHWGPNRGYRPARSHIPFAHALIDSGADIVFGHSCHVFQGIEVYRKRPILYSTGDFIDDYAVNPRERNDESFVFMVETGLLGIKRLKLYPTIIKDFQARLAGSGRREDIAKKMQTLCGGFGTRSRWLEREGCLEIS